MKDTCFLLIVEHSLQKAFADIEPVLVEFVVIGRVRGALIESQGIDAE